MYSDWPATFNGHSLVIGRINYWPLVLTWMTRTCPSWPGNTSSTRPRCHWPRGAFWSTTSTTSPTFRFSLASLHFFRVLSVDRYSSLQRFQSTLTRFWISLQRFLGWNAMSSVTWGASCPPSCPTKKWLGVNTGSSRGSAPSYVNGIEFINASTSLIAVCSSSSVSLAFPTIAFRVFLTTLTSDSNTPPKCDPSRGFQFHLIPLLATLPAICSWSIVWTSSLSSLSPLLQSLSHYHSSLLPVFPWWLPFGWTHSGNLWCSMNMPFLDAPLWLLST